MSLNDKPMLSRRGLTVWAALAPCLPWHKALAGTDAPEAEASGGVYVLGNPAAKVTIVEFFDYQCPYCRQSEKTIEAFLQRHPDARVEHRHWPIIGDPSLYAARIAMAASWQGKYAAAHAALITLSTPFNQDRVRQAVAAAGIDLDRLDSDLKQHEADINTTVFQTTMEAADMHLNGTPVFRIGKQTIAGTIDTATLEDAVAAAERQATP